MLLPQPSSSTENGPLSISSSYSEVSSTSSSSEPSVLNEFDNWFELWSFIFFSHLLPNLKPNHLPPYILIKIVFLDFYKKNEEKIIIVYMILYT